MSFAVAALRWAVATSIVGTPLLSAAAMLEDSPALAQPSSAPTSVEPQTSVGEPQTSPAEPQTSAAEPAPPGQPPAPTPPDAAASAPESATPHRSPSGEAATPDATDSDPATSPVLELSRSVAIDTVLACGLRLIAVEDASLPVAAVVLAVDVGSVDDPTELPGLVHALAYHLLEGNRELAPGASARILQDAGGFVSLATSPGQTRFETLVPLPSLGEALRIEATRLRAPTLSRERWENALTWASRDRDAAPTIPFLAWAAVHRQNGLAHDGRAVTPPLLALTPSALGQHLAGRFRYDRATLVVVAPHSPLATLASVQARFADLPARPRTPTTAQSPLDPPAGPRKVAGAPQASPAFAWPIAGTPAARLSARVWCRALNRQRSSPSDPKKAKVSCTFDPDARYPVLVVSITGSDDPLATLGARLTRLTSGADAQLLSRQRDFVRIETELSLAEPLPLARQLAMAAARDERDESVLRPIGELTGLQTFSEPQPNLVELARVLDLRRAVELVPPPPTATTP